MWSSSFRHFIQAPWTFEKDRARQRKRRERRNRGNASSSSSEKTTNTNQKGSSNVQPSSNAQPKGWWGHQKAAMGSAFASMGEAVKKLKPKGLEGESPIPSSSLNSLSSISQSRCRHDQTSSHFSREQRQGRLDKHSSTCPCSYPVLVGGLSDDYHRKPVQQKNSEKAGDAGYYLLLLMESSSTRLRN